MVPQDRDGQFQTELFDRYQRSEKAFVAALLQMYLEGVSTRKVTEITEALCGLEVSKSQVSALTQKLDAEVAEWRMRRLTDTPNPKRRLTPLKVTTACSDTFSPGCAVNPSATAKAKRCWNIRYGS
jgi:hypothetical protein